jgi:hypothetical protein
MQELIMISAVFVFGFIGGAGIVYAMVFIDCKLDNSHD